jgi:GT2 family glycosyltransferase
MGSISPATVSRKKVYVVIVNYNGWPDTLECLESVYRNDHTKWQVVLVDNDSGNDSLERIQAWADGKLNVWVPPDNPLRRRSFPPVRKPVRTVYYSRKEAESGGGDETVAAGSDADSFPPLVLVRAGENTGYAGGNNIGLRYAEKRGDGDYFWLLNNDTVVGAQSLKHLVEQAEQYGKSGARVGIVGSKLLHYAQPSLIQSLGGRYHPFTGKIFHVGAGERDAEEYRGKAVVKGFSYVSGASMLMSADFVREVGKLSEEYFLYFEELDLAERARRKGWMAVVCMGSAVYHKEGATIMGEQRFRDVVGDYHYLRGRLIVTRKYYRRFLWVMYLGLLVAVVNRVRRGQFDHIGVIRRVFVESFRERPA